MMQTKPLPNGGQEAAHTPHNLILENRRSLTATGVTRVIRCDETGAVLETQQGTLILGGRDLQVGELSLQTGELKVYGQLDALQYADEGPQRGSWLRRLGR